MLNLEAVHFCQFLDGFRKRKPVVHDQKFDRISTRTTTETMEKSSLGIDVKGRGLLGMKRTKPLEGRSGLFQIDPTGTDQAKNVSCLRNPADKIFAECHTKIMSSLKDHVSRDDFKPRLGM